MEKALDIDPDFAMAYRSLGASYANLGNLSKEKENYQKAFVLSDRVSEREQYLIQGNYYGASEKTYNNAIDAYEKLLEIFPGDNIWHISLGLIYFELEEWDKAIEHYEFSKQENVEPYLTYYNLGSAYLSKGRYDKAREVCQEYLELNPEFADFHFWLSYLFLFDGKFEDAVQEAEKLFSKYPTSHLNSQLMGDIQNINGNFIEAKKEYQKLLDDDRPIARLTGFDRFAYLSLLQGKLKESEDWIKQAIRMANENGREKMEWELHFDLIYVYLNSGMAKLALEECEKLWEKAIEKDNLKYQRLALLFKGLSYLGIDSPDEAQRTASYLKTLIEEGMNKKAMRYYFFLKGKIELDKKNFSKAVEYFSDAKSLLSAPFAEIQYYAIFLDCLALAHFKAGDLEQSHKEYERIGSLIHGRDYKGDIYAKSFYMLGKIYEEQGDTEKAIEHYEKFLELWKDADPGLPEIDDARTRLSKLEQTGGNQSSILN